MTDISSCSFSIELTDIDTSGSRRSVSTPAGLQRMFYDGDQIRGYVVVKVQNLFLLKSLSIELLGRTSVKVIRTEGSGAGPKSFRNKEVFLWRTQALVGTPPPQAIQVRTSPSTPSPITSLNRTVQLNRGTHIFAFELTLEAGCTPGSVRWQNISLPSQRTHNVTASIGYKLRVSCQPADSTKAIAVCKHRLEVGGFEHSRESLKAMASKGSGKSKLGDLTFPLMDGNVRFAATLDARTYHHGETALLTLVLENRLPHSINGVFVKFNNFVSLLGSSGKHTASSSFSLSSSTDTIPPSPTDETFSESEVLSVVNDRYIVKHNDNIKKVIQMVIPPGAFCTTKYTRSVNLMAYLDISISVDSPTPSVSEKNFQLPIYIINSLPIREAPLDPLTSSSDSLLSLDPDAFRKLISGDLAVPATVIWANDDEAASCTICSNDFTMLRRRHHCRHCGRIMCGKCGKEAKLDELFGVKPQKVCISCLDSLQKQNRSSLSEEFVSLPSDLDPNAATPQETSTTVSPRISRAPSTNFPTPTSLPASSETIPAPPEQHTALESIPKQEHITTKSGDTERPVTGDIQLSTLAHSVVQ